MFKKSKNLDRGVKKVDKLVTGIIIGSAIASIIGASQTDKGKEVTKDLKNKIIPIGNKTSKKAFSIFGKFIAFIVGIFSKK
ncbi:hypothetical protein H3C61_02670 [Candidatus Gracilibacteria bacterium]|nr:hypothetical protein [Candidatus Gracilibacteria bacterium]